MKPEIDLPYRAELERLKPVAQQMADALFRIKTMACVQSSVSAREVLIISEAAFQSIVPEPENEECAPSTYQAFRDAVEKTSDKK